MLNEKGILPWIVVAGALVILVVGAVVLANAGNIDCKKLSISKTESNGNTTISVSGIPADKINKTTLWFTCYNENGAVLQATEKAHIAHTFEKMPKGNYSCDIEVNAGNKSCYLSKTITVLGSSGGDSTKDYFEITVEPGEATISFDEITAGSVSESQTFKITFLNKSNKTFFVPFGEASFTNICSSAKEVSSCVTDVHGYVDLGAASEQYIIYPGKKLEIDAILNGITKPSSPVDYTLKAWINYSLRNDCLGNMMNPCTYERVESKPFYLHLRTVSQTDDDFVNYPPKPTEVEECKANGLKGKTGPGAIPYMILSWNWSDVQKYDCDHVSPGEPNAPAGEHFCDATQFSISLFKKLEEISRLVENNQQIPSRLTNFKVFLMADSFSDDFKEDFVDYYVFQFFSDTPAWFYETGNWNRYFVDRKADGTYKANDSIEFVGDTSQPGIYSVFLQFEPDKEKGYAEGLSRGFFNGTEPRLKIKVKLQLESPYNSPLLKMPFNGNVGVAEKNADRTGYGIINSANKPLFVSSDKLISVPRISGSKRIDYSEETGFERLNWTDRGKVMVLGENSVISFKNDPIDIVLGVDAEKGDGQFFGAFYRVFDGSGNLIRAPNGTPYFSNWTALRTSSNLSCGGFLAEEIDFDSPASVFRSDTCVSGDLDKTYGFWWTYTSKKTGKLLLETIMYVPQHGNYSIEKVCDDSSFIGINGQSGKMLSLMQSQYSVGSIEDLLNLVKEKKICVTEDGSTFFWNEPKLFSESNARKATDAEWGKGTFNSLMHC